MKVSYVQGVVGKLLMIPLVTVALIGFAPIADPAGRIVAVALGFFGALLGLALYALLLGRAASTEVGSGFRYVFGALTGYEHGSIGTGMTAFRGAALLFPFGAWAFSVLAALS